MWERRTTEIDEPDIVGGCQNVIQKYLNSMAMVKEVANHELKRNAVKEIMNKSWELKSIV